METRSVLSCYVGEMLDYLENNIDLYVPVGWLFLCLNGPGSVQS